MSDKANNPINELSEDDLKILDRLSLTYIVKLYAKLEKFPNPRIYARNRLKNELKKDSSLALVHSVIYVKNTSSDTFTPGELNRKLAEEIPEFIRKSPTTESLIGSEDSAKGFLSSRELRERVLEPLEESKIISHLEKEEIPEKYKRTHYPGKKSANEVEEYDSGGMMSVYMISKNMEQLKHVMQKPSAIDYIYDKLMESGVALKINRYIILAMLNLMKLTGEKGAVRLVNIGASADQVRLSQEEIGSIQNLSVLLQKLDDSKLGKLADALAHRLTGMKDYYRAMSGILGFMKL